MLTLHPYQEIAVRHLHDHPHSALFLDMGLGKTAIALSALTPDHLPALVIAPKRVAETVWQPERDLWRPDLTLGVAAGSRDRRQDVQRSLPDITVLGRDNISDVVGRGYPYRTVILDELSGFKNRGSVRWRTARKLVSQPSVTHVWGLTGTPSPNGLMDLWAQVFLLDGGERLGRTLTAFRNRYFMPGRQLPNGIITEWNLRPESSDNIHRLLEDICLSMGTDGRVDLPPVTRNPVSVPLPKSVQRMYKTIKRDLVADLELLGGEVHTAMNAAVLSSKLSQISAGFLYVDDADLRDGAYDRIHLEKTRAVQEVVAGTGGPVLVFYRFRAELDMLREAMPDLLHTIDEPDSVARWNQGRIPVLAAHPASAGHGLNLQHGGHTIVWTSLPWSLEEWDQGNKRLARQGQKNPVVIHMLLSPKTIDGAIRDRLQEKTTIQQALLDHLESPL